jgi:hypothetical protein
MTREPDAKMTDPRFCDGAKGGVFRLVQRTLNGDGIHRQKVPFARKKCAHFCKPAGTFRKNFQKSTPLPPLVKEERGFGETNTHQRAQAHP